MKFVTVLFILIFLSIPKQVISQAKLNAILNVINNQGMEVGIIIKNPYDTLSKRESKNAYNIVSPTFNSNINNLITEFSKDSVIAALIRLLPDTSKDYIANCLLYEIINNRELSDFYYYDRAKWVKERMIIDKAKWRLYYRDKLKL